MAKKQISLAPVKSYSVHLPGCPKQKPLPISLFQFPGSSWITDWYPLSLAHKTMSSSKNPSILGPIQRVRKEYENIRLSFHTYWPSTVQPSWADLQVGGSRYLCADTGSSGPETHYTACGHTEQDAPFVSVSPNIWHCFTESKVPKGLAVPLNTFQDTSKTWSAEAKAIRNGEMSSDSIS